MMSNLPLNGLFRHIKYATIGTEECDMALKQQIITNYKKLLRFTALCTSILNLTQNLERSTL
jgi:hypothetical protein